MATRDWKLLPPSHDGKKFLLREQGPGPDGKPRGFGVLVNADGSGQPQRFDLGIVAGQTWFLKRPDYSFMFATDRDVRGNAPDRQWVCEPAREWGGPHTRRTRALQPRGRQPQRQMDRLSDQSGRRMDHRRQQRHRTTGACAGPHSGGGHLSWECDDRWLVASMGNGIYEVWVEGEHPPRLLCAPNTHHSMRTECEPESSPDGTKFAYVSSMLGDCDVYVGVQRLPDPPRNIRRQGRVLSWDPPEHAASWPATASIAARNCSTASRSASSATRCRRRKDNIRWSRSSIAGCHRRARTIDLRRRRRGWPPRRSRRMWSN